MTRSWISDGDGRSVVLEVEKTSPDSALGRDYYTVRVIRKSPSAIRRELSTQGYEWSYTLETGFGSFAHSAAKAVSDRASSEEEAVVLAAASGHPPTFVFRMEAGRFCEIWDVERGESLWKGSYGKDGESLKT